MPYRTKLREIGEKQIYVIQDGAPIEHLVSAAASNRPLCGEKLQAQRSRVVFTPVMDGDMSVTGQIVNNHYSRPDLTIICGDCLQRWRRASSARQKYLESQEE